MQGNKDLSRSQVCMRAGNRTSNNVLSHRRRFSRKFFLVRTKVWRTQDICVRYSSRSSANVGEQEGVHQPATKLFVHIQKQIGKESRKKEKREFFCSLAAGRTSAEKQKQASKWVRRENVVVFCRSFRALRFLLADPHPHAPDPRPLSQSDSSSTRWAG